MNTRADDDLKRALDQLELTLEHLPDFDERLTGRLDEEAALRQAHNARPSHHRRRRGPLALAAATVLAGLAGLVLVLVGLPGREGGGIAPGPEPATAAERMVAKMTYAMSNATSLTGKLRVTLLEDSVIEGSFAMTSDGDYRLETTQTAGKDEAGYATTLLVYDADAHRLVYEREGEDSASRVWTNVAGPPAPQPLYPHWWMGDVAVYQQYASAVKSLVADGSDDVTVTEADYEGRAVWVASIPLDWSRWVSTPGSATMVETEEGATIEITVDQETGLLLRFARVLTDRRDWIPGIFPFELRLSDLEVDAGLPDELFRVQGEEQAETETGYSTFSSISDAADAAGYQPLVPARLPEGFAISDSSWMTWTDASPLSWLSSWSEYGRMSLWGRSFPVQAGEQPPNQESVGVEVDLQYRRGLDWFIIRQMSSRSLFVGGDEQDLREATDSLFDDPWSYRGYRRYELESGALAGRTAYTWLFESAAGAGENAATTSGHCGLLVLGQEETDLSVLIAGSLTREELLAAANSLRVFEE